MAELIAKDDRLRLMIRHSWRVRRLRPALIAVIDRVVATVDRLTRGAAATQVWQKQVPWYIGKYLVEPVNRGIVRLDDCKLDTNNETFTTFTRGSLWLHRYEEPERLAIVRFLDPNLPVLELGASVGAMSCLINRRLRHPDAHVAVEPSPQLMPLLARNREVNRASFTSVQAAVAYDSASLGFSPGLDNLEGHVDVDGGVTVPTATVTELLDRFRFERASLVCDIEGMEVQLWAHESHVIAERVAWLIIELHPWIYGQDTADRLIEQFKSQGFSHEWTRSCTFVFRNARWPSHLGDGA